MLVNLPTDKQRCEHPTRVFPRADYVLLFCPVSFISTLLLFSELLLFVV